MVNFTAISFFFYFSIYDMLSSIGNETLTPFSLPGHLLALGYGLLNILYHYKESPIEINLILLYVISILFYVAYLNMFIFQALVFDLYWRTLTFVTDAVPVYLVCMRCISCTITIVTFLILRHADIR